MSNRSSSVPELPPELVELVVSRLQPFDLARMATISHLFHSLAMNAIIVWGKGCDFDLPTGGGSVRSLCFKALICESSPPALAAAATQHSFFIDDGALFSCGRPFDSARGILGHGKRATIFSTPTRIPSSFGGQRVVSVSTSESSALAIAEDGSLWSWGNGAHGRLGHGDTERLFTPTRIEAFGETQFVSVSAGSYHSLALGVDGTVWEWGYLNQAQLQLLPKKIDFDLPIIAISAGKQRNLVLTADGAVWSWGIGRDGILGHGDSHDQLCPKRVEALLGHRIVAVSAAASHSLVLSDDGSVFSFGLSYYGKLGHGDSADSKRWRRTGSLRRRRWRRP